MELGKKSLIFSTIDLSNSHDEDIAAIIAHNKRMERHIKCYQVVIDALRLAILRGEKRKDIDYIAKNANILDWLECLKGERRVTFQLL